MNRVKFHEFDLLHEIVKMKNEQFFDIRHLQLIHCNGNVNR